MNWSIAVLAALLVAAWAARVAAWRRRCARVAKHFEELRGQRVIVGYATEGRGALIAAIDGVVGGVVDGFLHVEPVFDEDNPAFRLLRRPVPDLPSRDVMISRIRFIEYGGSRRDV